MNILTDLHTHTIASTHAYSTVTENVMQAKKKGLEAIAVTDHSPDMPDGPHMWHFSNLKAVPRQIEGVYVLRGVEADISDIDGTLDMPEEELEHLDVVGASIHKPHYTLRGEVDFTQAYLNALDNKYVDFIGHSGNPDYPYDYERVIKKAMENHQLIEINASSFHNRKRNIHNCREIALCCKRLGAGICVNSDAHICFSVGGYDPAVQMLEEIDFPYELIMNRRLQTFIDYIKPRKEINL